MNNSRLNKWPLPVLVVLLAASSASHAQPVVNSSKLTVEQTAGPVKVRLSERWRTPANGMIMGMPSIASTGVDGSIKVRQEATVISVAASTAVEFLDGNVPGEPIQRVIQERGSAFYDIAPRGENKLRVEAAYLAAVVKGTQFHVIVEDDSTTISLYEGELQIEAPGVGDSVDIFAGQIARIHRDDARISVISMENGEPVARNDGAVGTSRSTAAATTGGAAGATGRLTTGVAETETTLSLGLAGVDASVSADAGIGSTKVSGSLSAELDPGSGNVSAGAGVGAGLGNGALDAGIEAGADLGAGEVDLGVEVGALDVDASLDLGLSGEVGESLTGDLGEILEDTTSEPDPADAGTGDPLPDLGDLLGL